MGSSWLRRLFANTKVSQGQSAKWGFGRSRWRGGRNRVLERRNVSRSAGIKELIEASEEHAECRYLLVGGFGVSSMMSCLA